ncbi:GntR family transcriptional regulator [Altererythrobacter sp. B11]|uniref:GntR family transcriptional regulator n=1 Tax=Altererythrobacter sp. B11 TaxID=2060312 RepID=UPI000DC6EF04|nr:GntR family transcriptional regulator [Altererythrobacter sp. B11]BBC73572.1 GntR family transcriptional regulator [Altererythrobacter sp. B11]
MGKKAVEVIDKGFAEPSNKPMQNGSLENTVKEMILREDLAPGERLTEAGLAELLGVSRTPVRSLLPMLAAQGFLEPVGKRGYVVAKFGEKEIFDALDLRAMLEGWAARKLAEEGASEEVLAKLDECLAEGDRLFDKGSFSLDDENRYGSMNERFHRLVIEACTSPILTTFMERLEHVPFVAPSVIVFDQIGLRKAFEMLHRAHGFHHAIVDAIRDRDGARAEFLFREHANHQRVSMFARRKASASA